METTESTGQTFTFEKLRYQGSGNMWAVSHNGKVIGKIKRERVAFDGYAAFTPETRQVKVGRKTLESQGLLADDGFLVEFPTREAAAEALLLHTQS